MSLFVLHLHEGKAIIYSIGAPKKKGIEECRGTMAELVDYCKSHKLDYKIAGL
jgi:hypothetical protein